MDAPKYSPNAAAATATLYSPLQDVCIYVEDSSIKEVYNSVIRRLQIEDVKFHSVIPLGSRNDVLEHASKHPGVTRCCYLVDGDLYYALGKNDFHHDRRIMAHSLYCFENYLFNADACCSIVYEEKGSLSRSDTEQLVAWEQFVFPIRKLLVPLFAVYAVAFELSPSICTVQNGIGTVANNSRGQLVLDATKVRLETVRVIREMHKGHSGREIREMISNVKDRLRGMKDPVNIISGKDYLLRLLSSHMSNKCAASVKQRSLKMRLARNTKIDSFEAIKQHIKANLK